MLERNKEEEEEANFVNIWSWSDLGALLLAPPARAALPTAALTREFSKTYENYYAHPSGHDLSVENFVQDMTCV